MNLFFDECVSAGAAVHFRNTTDHATCHPRDINMSGATDPEVLEYCIQIDHLLITVNGKDFRKLCGTPDQLHPGLVIIPSVSKARQIELIEVALEFINNEAPPQSPQDWMVNRVVEVDSSGSATQAQLPKENSPG